MLTLLSIRALCKQQHLYPMPNRIIHNLLRSAWSSTASFSALVLSYIGAMPIKAETAKQQLALDDAPVQILMGRKATELSI